MTQEAPAGAGGSPELDECGCCSGLTRLTPADLANPPGATALTYRVGTHGKFKASMLVGAGSIQSLATRADDDPAIALFDAAAVMLDVLTFYQERIANEGYLRTATERFSVLELAHEIGYELRPGVAAGTVLAFEMESAPNSASAGASSPAPAPSVPETAVIPIGTQVQSIPGQDEKPQTFETVEQITARRIWNRLPVQAAQMALPATGQDEIYLAGTATNLRRGDKLLVVSGARLNSAASGAWDMATVREVETATPPSGAPYTVAHLVGPLNLGSAPLQSAKVFALRQQANLFGHNAPSWRTMPASFRAGYLGLNEDGNAAEIAAYADWPGFTLAAVAETVQTPASGTGLYGEYYNSLDFTAPAAPRVDPTINFNWGTGSPKPDVGPDTFSIRWTGAVEAKVSGLHTFKVTVDDGARLWVNGRLVVNSWQVQPVTDATGTTTLQTGQKVDIKLEYFENGGSATIILKWSAAPGAGGGGGLAEEVVPASQLYTRDLNAIHLDATYPQFTPGSWVVLACGGPPGGTNEELFRIDAATDMPRASFALSGKTTRLALAGNNLRETFNDRLRETAVYGQSEELALAPRPIDDPVFGSLLTLDSLQPELTAPRTMILNGKRIRLRTKVALQLTAADGVTTVNEPPGESLLVERYPVRLPGPHTPVDDQWQFTLTDKNRFTGSVLFPLTLSSVPWALEPSLPADPVVSEVVEIDEMVDGSDPTSFRLASALTRVYDRPTVFLFGNVSRATHGQTRKEVLGSGDGAKSFQSFGLKQEPLTFVSAANAAGAETTLQVRVNDVLWHEAPSLYEATPRDRVFIARRDDDGNVTVVFGDGVNGARPPSGDENVQAVYRTGIGTDGLLKANQLSLLITRPLGVKSATNPIATSGAADPESRDDARQNAPFTVLTLDRIVSLRDFEDFARSFGGIGKARAARIWDGEARLVHVTIAAAARNGPTAAGDFTVDPQSDLFKNLRTAMDGARDTQQRLEIASYEPRYFRLTGRVLVYRDYLPDKVQAAVLAALQSTFSFGRRGFAQGVHQSEVLSVMQAVDGVKAAFVTALYLRGAAATLEERLGANPALPVAGAGGTLTGISPAQLLLLDPVGVDITTEVEP